MTTRADRVVPMLRQPLAHRLRRRAVMRLKATPGVRADLVYAWAEEAALLRRYTETRRRHPMAPQGRVIDFAVPLTFSRVRLGALYL